MMISISNFHNVDEFKRAFSGCTVSVLGNETFPVEYLTEVEFNNRKVDGVFNPNCLEWYSIDQVSCGV